MSEVYHVIPINDLIDHIESVECPCDPEVKYTSDGELVVHNAIDRREVFEQRNLYNNLGATPDSEAVCNSCEKLIRLCECTGPDGKSVWDKVKQRG